MTDIVERLREHNVAYWHRDMRTKANSLLHEAADEIERLRGMKMAYERLKKEPPVTDIMERLRRCACEDGWAIILWQHAQQAADEIERLIRERDEARALLQATANDNARLAAIVAKLDREQFDRWCSARRPGESPRREV